jgi:hypothetical protein
LTSVTVIRSFASSTFTISSLAPPRLPGGRGSRTPSAAGGQQSWHPGLVHPNADAIAGDARLGDLEQRAADLITVADAPASSGNPFDREVLAELSVDEIGPLQLPLPIAIRFDPIDEDGPLLTPVRQGRLDRLHLDSTGRPDSGQAPDPSDRGAPCDPSTRCRAEVRRSPIVVEPCCSPRGHAPQERPSIRRGHPDGSRVPVLRRPLYGARSGIVASLAEPRAIGSPLTTSARTAPRGLAGAASACRPRSGCGTGAVIATTFRSNSRPDQPVDRVLEDARQAVAVLGRGDEDRIARCDLSGAHARRTARRPDRCRIEVWQVPEPRVEHDLDTVRCDRRSRFEEGQVRGSRAQTSDDPEDSDGWLRPAPRRHEPPTSIGHTRPGSRSLISCNSQTLPSGSRNEAYEP